MGIGNFESSPAGQPLTRATSAAADMLPDKFFEEVRGLMAEVARLEVMPRFRTLAPEQIAAKPDKSLVTEADLAAEAWLKPRLLKLLPGSLVLGEEEGVADPATLRAVAPGGGWVWTVDPVDGTGAFARGETRFGMMIGLILDGQPVGGWIYGPATGAFSGGIVGGPVVGVRPMPEGALIGSTDCKWMSSEDRDAVHGRRAQLTGVREHVNSSQEFLALAAGDSGFFLTSHLSPWDVVPGAALVTAMGGTAAYLDGSPFDPLTLRGAAILARTSDVWTAARDALVPGWMQMKPFNSACPALEAQVETARMMAPAP